VTLPRDGVGLSRHRPRRRAAPPRAPAVVACAARGSPHRACRRRSRRQPRGAGRPRRAPAHGGGKGGAAAGRCHPPAACTLVGRACLAHEKQTRHARARTRTDVRRGEEERRGAVARPRTHTRRRTGRVGQPRAVTAAHPTAPPLRRGRRPGPRRAGRPPRRARTAPQRASEGGKKDGLAHGDCLGDAGASSHASALTLLLPSLLLRSHAPATAAEAGARPAAAPADARGWAGRAPPSPSGGGTRTIPPLLSVALRGGGQHWRRGG